MAKCEVNGSLLQSVATVKNILHKRGRPVSKICHPMLIQLPGALQSLALSQMIDCCFSCIWSFDQSRVILIWPLFIHMSSGPLKPTGAFKNFPSLPCIGNFRHVSMVGPCRVPSSKNGQVSPHFEYRTFAWQLIIVSSVINCAKCPINWTILNKFSSARQRGGR